MEYKNIVIPRLHENKFVYNRVWVQKRRVHLDGTLFGDCSCDTCTPTVQLPVSCNIRDRKTAILIVLVMDKGNLPIIL